MNRAEQVIEHTLNGYLDHLRRQQEATRMSQIPEAVAGDAARVLGFVERHWPHQQQDQSQQEEHTMTTPAGAPTSELPWWSALHQNLAVFDSRLQTFLPKIQTIATNPALDEGVEALLAAFAGPMAPEVFAGVITLLKADPADHMDAAISLLTTVAHQAPAKSTAMAELAEAGAQAARQFAADQQAAPAGTGSQTAMAPRVI